MWGWLIGITHVAKAAWGSVVMTLLFAAVINLAPQSREVFLVAVDHPLQMLWLTLATMVLAVTSWFSARLMLRYKSGFERYFPATHSRNAGTVADLPVDAVRFDPGTLAAIIFNLPRLIGAAAFLAVAVALAVAAFVDGAPKLGLIVAAVLNGIGAVAFYLVTRAIRWGSKPAINGFPTFSADLPTLPARFKGVGIVLVLLSIALFLGGWLWPVEVGGFFGTIAILALAVSGWIAGLVTLHVWQRNTAAPLVLVIPLFLLLFSLCNDNHAIRTLPGDGLADARPNLEEFYTRWVERHQDRPAPLIIVATSGGGIRAAYWTANVLGTLQDKYPRLHDDLFAISSVSGGSIGAAVFETLLVDARKSGDDLVPDCTLDGKKPGFATCGREVLSGDFLAPTLMSMLYPDVMQRFLPVAFLPDRASALEQSWEAGWDKVGPKGRFAMPFSAFWTRKPTDLALPALFLNSTSTVRGQRIMTSTVKFDSGLREATDLLQMGPQDRRLNLRVSSAANNSARFPYVGPTGKYQADPQDGVVDGGYFDNFGAVTAQELVGLLQPMIAETRTGRPTGILVIQISNDPLFVGKLVSENPDLNQEDNERCNNTVHDTRSSNMAEQLTDPIKTFFSVWNGRAYYNAIDLRDMTANIKGGVYVHFRVMPNRKQIDDPPLGWTLSRQSQSELDRQIEVCQKPKMDALVNCLGNWQACTAIVTAGATPQ